MLLVSWLLVYFLFCFCAADETVNQGLFLHLRKCSTTEPHKIFISHWFFPQGTSASGVFDFDSPFLLKQRVLGLHGHQQNTKGFIGIYSQKDREESVFYLA